MSSRVAKSAEAEQRVACIALQGLCMMDSQSGYYPEGESTKTLFIISCQYRGSGFFTDLILVC